MIYGIGCDIAEVARIRKASERESFLRRVFSESELAAFAKLKDPCESMAGAWAAKEAFSKALHTGVRGFELTDISVLHDKLGAPYLELCGSAKMAAKALKVHISISHTHEYAVAYCVLERVIE